MLPTIEFFDHQVSRLICGGNPQSGYSHFSSAMDQEMIDYYTMPMIQQLLDNCLRHGINTFQSRGDRHQMRAFHEHQLNGGQIKWIAQTASEFANQPAHISELARYQPIAIYNHGTLTDNYWHTGRIDEIREIIHAIHDQGLPAGVGTHIPEVLEYIEEQGWDVDFYLCCFYNLARSYKSAPAVDQDAYARDRFPAEDPPRMTAVMRGITKPCLGFKILAATRNCTTPEATRAAFAYAYSSIKPTDAVVVGMFPKYRDQIAENAGYTQELLAPKGKPELA